MLTGGLYKDVWYVAGGNSWMAQFLKDANADYLWSNTEETGSIGLSLESVLENAQDAEYWFNPSAETKYSELTEANPHYQQFSAFTIKKCIPTPLKKVRQVGLFFTSWHHTAQILF